MRGQTPNQPGWPALLIRWLTAVVVIAKKEIFFFCLCQLRKGLNNNIISLIKAKHLGSQVCVCGLHQILNIKISSWV